MSDVEILKSLCLGKNGREPYAGPLFYDHYSCREKEMKVTFVLGKAHSIIAFFLMICITSYALGSNDNAGLKDGYQLFEENCAQCHNGSVPKAVTVISLQKMDSNKLTAILNEGVMQSMAKHLTDDERREIVAYLSRDQNSAETASSPLLCKKKVTFDDSQPIMISGGGDERSGKYSFYS